MCVCVCVCVCACACACTCVCMYMYMLKWENKLCYVIAEVQTLVVRRFFSILSSILCYFRALTSVLGLGISDSSVKIFLFVKCFEVPSFKRYNRGCCV